MYKGKIFPINFRRWHLTNQFAVYFHTVGVETEIVVKAKIAQTWGYTTKPKRHVINALS